MKEQYDFSNAAKNPYAKKLEKEIADCSKSQNEKIVSKKLQLIVEKSGNL